jgi:hypothetical protein
VIGAGYGFLVLPTLGLATIAFALVLIPFLVVIAGTRLRLGAAAVGVAAGLGFIVGFFVGWAWLLVPLRCGPPACELAATPLQDAVGGVIFLAIPFLLVAGALAIRRLRMKA